MAGKKLSGWNNNNNGMVKGKIVLLDEWKTKEYIRSLSI
jgi:hypothetical protein